MIRTLKRPKVHSNLKFTLKRKIYFVIKKLKNNTYLNTFELKYNVSELKNDFNNLSEDINKLKLSLLELKEDLGYNDFIEISSNSHMDSTTTNEESDSKFSVAPTQALTVVKTRFTFKYW